MTTTADISIRNAAFELNLKTTPRLVFPRFRLQVVSIASQMCNDITGPTGLLAWVFTPAQWAAIPGNSAPDAAGAIVVQPIFDILTNIAQPPPGAPAATVKYYEIARNERSEVKRGINTLRTYLINSAPDDDISEMSDPIYGMMLVTLQEIFTHVEIKHGTLNQEDLEVIYATLRAVKSPSSDFSALAETHRNLHRLLAGAGQPCAEFDKTQHYINAIKDDPSGREAVNIFIRNHPLVANRTFVDLVATVLLHAPTIISSTSSLGYSNALATTTVVTALAAAPTDESALKQQIAKLQKDLAATHNRTKGPPRAHGSAPAKTGALHYCWVHGYQYSHLGSTCKVMLNDKKYTVQQKAAADPTNPAGGNTAIKG
jgi:hypothetical protein